MERIPPPTFHRLECNLSAIYPGRAAFDVRRNGSAYERELRDLLQGDGEALARYTHRVEPENLQAVPKLSRAPFLVIRAAGSLGFDLVALRNEFAFPLEVKASRSDTIRFSDGSGRAREQLKAHRAAAGRVGVIVLYAYRRVGGRSEEPWRVFAAPSHPVFGRMEYLRRQLPSVDETRNGNAVLRWRDGMPLCRFLEMISFLTTRPGADVS
jgi:Holliday junction resolvase